MGVRKEIVMDHSKLTTNDEIAQAYNNVREALDDLLHVAEKHDVDLTDSEWQNIMTSSLWSSRFGDATCAKCEQSRVLFPSVAIKGSEDRMTEFVYTCPDHGMYSVHWDASSDIR
jgi:hypothetical protein